MSGSWPMTTIASQIEKRAKSCGYTVPRTPGVKIHKRGEKVWQCDSLIDARGEAVGPRWFWIEKGVLKMGREAP